MKLAVVQSAIIWENKVTNLKKAEQYIQKAAKQGADLAVFPEMSFTGFSMNIGLTAEYNEETLQTVAQMAKKYRLAVGFGWVKAAEHKAQNHYTVVNRDGEMLFDYTKIHPFSYSGEDQWFEGGDKLSYFELDGVKIGTLICYDLRFSEPFQILAEQCDIILVPANWPAGRRIHWMTLLKARAIETQCYLAGINCCGSQQELLYSGDSAVIAPDGSMLLEYQQKEGIFFVDIPGDVKNFREEFPTRRDRRWDLYSEWYQNQLK